MLIILSPQNYVFFPTYLRLPRSGQGGAACGFFNAVEALAASEFTEEAPAEQLEISFTAHLDSEAFPQVEAALYRWDGESCLAVVDGEPVCLVDRSAVVDLMEAVRTIVLGGGEET